MLVSISSMYLPVPTNMLRNSYVAKKLFVLCLNQHSIQSAKIAGFLQNAKRTPTTMEAFVRHRQVPVFVRLVQRHKAKTGGQGGGRDSFAHIFDNRQPPLPHPPRITGGEPPQLDCDGWPDAQALLDTSQPTQKATQPKRSDYIATSSPIKPSQLFKGPNRSS